MNERNGLMGGLILILIGAFFLLRNFGLMNVPLFDNWWAIFILIPAVASLLNAWRTYQAHGRFTGEVIGSFIGSLVLFCVALIFLLQLDWGDIWPIFLILGGLSILLRGTFQRNSS